MTAARQTLEEDDRASRGAPFAAEQVERRNRLLDAQAALPPASERVAHERGWGPGEPPWRGGAARLRRAGRAGRIRPVGVRTAGRARATGRAQTDRQGAGAPPRAAAAVRSARQRARPGHGAAHGNQPAYGAQPASAEQAMDESGPRAPDATDPPRQIWRPQQPPRPGSSPESESSVMRDAREVAARRKRQLGEGRP